MALSPGQEEDYVMSVVRGIISYSAALFVISMLTNTILVKYENRFKNSGGMKMSE
jgi:hypothetical protein